MDPISSNSATRAPSSIEISPLKAESLSPAEIATKPESEGFTASNPVSELQLQRTQVVEDLGRTQQTRAELQETERQLTETADLARQASNEDLSTDDRQSLQSQFESATSQLSERESNPISIQGNLNTSSAANESREEVDSAISSVQSQLKTVTDQEQQLVRAFTPTQENQNRDVPKNPDQAEKLAQQVQQQIQSQPDNALNSQSQSVAKQTALTLFQ